MSCVSIRMTKAVIKIFKQETDRRIEGNSNDAFRYNFYGL